MLNQKQESWVQERVGQEFGPSRLTNHPVLADVQEGDGQFPERKEVLNSILEALTQEQVDFFMDDSRYITRFHMVPITSLSHLGFLINAYSPPQRGLSILSDTRPAMRQTDFPDNRIVRWEWAFIQGNQATIDSRWGDDGTTLEEKRAQFRENLPVGVQGLDRFDWSMLMSDSLRRGTPLDTYPDPVEIRPFRSQISALDREPLIHYTTEDYIREYGVTPLEPINEWSLIGGVFCDHDARPRLKSFSVQTTWEWVKKIIHFRAAIRGTVC